MKREAADPEAYLASVDDVQRELLLHVRDVIRRVMPSFDERLRYGMLDYPGLANLAAQKHYVALYVAPDVLKAHKQAFPGVNAGKSCLRFKRIDQADPSALETLLRDVLAFREGETR